MTARTKDFPSDDPSAGRSFAYVIFCAPPSGSEDYPGELRDALKYWNGRGTFVFTSSSAVYKNEDGAECDETSEVYDLGESPRVDRLLNAEKVVLDAGGVVCRLAGLYHSQRGAHKYFIKTPRLDSRADALVNLIHYEDAAELCIAALMSHTKSTVFLGTDGVPVTREAIARLAVNSGATTTTPPFRVYRNRRSSRSRHVQRLHSSSVELGTKIFQFRILHEAGRRARFLRPADASKRRRRKWIFPSSNGIPSFLCDGHHRCHGFLRRSRASVGRAALKSPASELNVGGARGLSVASDESALRRAMMP